MLDCSHLDGVLDFALFLDFLLVHHLHHHLLVLVLFAQGQALDLAAVASHLLDRDLELAVHALGRALLPYPGRRTPFGPNVGGVQMFRFA